MSNIQGRKLATACILTIITLGIYGIYWMIKLNNEINELAGEPEATSGGMVILYIIITCGLYSVYWYYKMGQRCNVIEGTTGNEVLLIILSIFCPIMADAIMQDKINKKIGF